MGRVKITLRMMNEVLSGRFELVLYPAKSKGDRGALSVEGRNNILDGGLDTLCEQMGLDLDTELGSLTSGFKPNAVELYVASTEAMCDRIYRALLDGELAGSVGNYRPKGGDTDAAGET